MDRWHLSKSALLITSVIGTAMMVAFTISLVMGTRVTVVTAVRGKGVEAVYATGTVEAENRIKLRAKANGRIVELLAREGEVVKKGARLARIDAPDVAAELKRGLAEHDAASAAAADNSPQLAALRGEEASIQAELAQVGGERVRLLRLVKRGAIARVELDRITARLRALQGALSANMAQQRALRVNLAANATGSAARVEALETQVANTDIRAPMDGVVLTRAVDLGDDVTIQQPLFEIGSPTLIVEAMVDEADVGRIRAGKRGAREPEAGTAEQTLQADDKGRASVAAVRLYAFPNEVFAGKVVEVLADADRDRKSFHVKVMLDSPPEGLRSGMSAELNIITRERENVILVPREAERGGAVWVVENGSARRREVELGLRDLTHFEIVKGVNEGELVVLDGQEQLEDGARVRATSVPVEKLNRKPLQTKAK